jgi:peptide/nickel transport system substrate-binding protein
VPRLTGEERLFHRAASFIVAVVCAILVLSGCAPRTEPAAEHDKPQARVQKLTIALPLDTGPLNVYSSDSSFDYLVDLVYDKLLAPSPYVNQPIPGLAESVTQLDSHTWSVKVRDGVTWHDGKAFTAEDVKFTYESYRDGAPSRYTHHVNMVPKIDQISIDAPRTVRFVCNYACPSLGAVTFADLPILPKHIWENVKEPQTYKNLPIGTGPFKLVELRPDQFYRFQANESYFMGRPLVDELVMPIIKDPNATFTALKTGEIDIAVRDVPPELRTELSRLPTIATIRTSPLSLVQLYLNFERVPFDRPEFRRALSLMIDRKQIVDTVLLGDGRPATQGFNHPDSPWTKPGLSTPFDREAATRLLDGLQFVDRNNDGIRETPAGKPLAFVVTVPSNEPVWMRVVEMVAKQAQAVGIKLTVQSLDLGTVLGLFTTRQFDIYVTLNSPHGVADPDQFVMAHLSGNLWKPGIPYPALDSLLDEWKKTTDIESRKQVSFRMQELFNNQPTAIPLYYPTSSFAFRPAAYNSWVESPGFGIVHKWSFLPAEARVGAVVAPRQGRTDPP